MNARRIVLLIVLALTAGLFIQPVRGYRASEARLSDARADLVAAQAERARVERQLADLDTRAALVREARAQGYIFPGETPFSLASP